MTYSSSIPTLREMRRRSARSRSLDTLYEFASTARGPSKPIAILRGNATGLHVPAQLGIPQPIATPIPGGK
ncbi:MAG: hypothetical protein ABI431_01150 [Candidatus Tumulicola sp.]